MRPPSPKGHEFRAVLAQRAPAGEPARPPPATAALGAPLEKKGRSDQAPERDPEPRAVPRPPPPDALREPGPACFGGGPASPVPLSAAAGAPLSDPTQLAAVAERVLRSLRVGTDAQGRSLVQLDLAEGPFAGCRIELRRMGSGVAVEVRDPSGAADPREVVVQEALRRRGIEVV